jgi:hypothetical protein
MWPRDHVIKKGLAEDQITGLRSDFLIVDDLRLAEVKTVGPGLYTVDIESADLVPGSVYIVNTITARLIGESDASLRGRIIHEMLATQSDAYRMEWKKQRFGKLQKEYPGLGEIRKQKKAPHTEVLYVWLGLDTDKPVLRSVPNCSNDQLTEAIRNAGKAVEEHKVTQRDGEQLLDLMYSELQRRVDHGEKIRAGRYRGEKPNAT